MFQSDQGSQSNKGRSRYLTSQIRAGTLSSQIKTAQVWPRLRYGLVECGLRGRGSLVVGYHITV